MDCDERIRALGEGESQNDAATVTGCTAWVG